jgi:hypothetical protein
MFNILLILLLGYDDPIIAIVFGIFLPLEELEKQAFVEGVVEVITCTMLLNSINVLIDLV